MTPTPHGGNGGYSSPLVAVLLITATSSRGPQLVFRYPRKPRLLRRYSKVRYYAAKQRSNTTTTAERSNLGAKGHLDDFQARREREIEEERRRDRDQWDEQEEDSGSEGEAGHEGDDSDSGSLTSLSSLSSHGGALSGTRAATGADTDGHQSESDVGLTTASSDAEEDTTAGDAASAPRRRGRRRPDHTDNAISRLQMSRAQIPSTSSNGGSAPRNNLRSPSRARVLAASSLRDPTANSSPERESVGGPARGNLRRGQPGSGSNARGGNHQPATTSAAERDNSPSRRAKNARAFSQYLGYPAEFLAELLAPKEEMCNRRFELVVDDLAFVGHPVMRHIHDDDDDEGDDEGTPERPAGGNRTEDEDEARGRRGRDGEIPPSNTVDSTARKGQSSRTKKLPKVTMFHLVFVLQPPDPSYATPTLDLTTWLGFWYDSVAFKMTAALWAEERRCEYVSHEAHLLSKLWGEVVGNSGSGPSYALHLSRLLLLSTLAKTLKNVHRALSRPSPHRAPFVTLNDSLDVHLQLPPLLVEPARMVKSLLELGPSIEAEDAELWGGATGGVTGVAGGGGAEIASALDEWTRTTGPPLFPWKTLLLLHDPGARPKRYRSIGAQIVQLESDDEDADAAAADDIDAELAENGFADAGIELWAKKFTSLLKPNLQGIPTFADLASLLSWDLQEDVYPMARHLIYYKQARVTDVPRIQNTYSLSPLFEVKDLSRFATSFALRFPQEPPLARILAAVGSSFQPFISHYLAVQSRYAGQGEPAASKPVVSAKSRRRAALDCLTWLLRHEIVLQQHLRFRLIATEAVKKKAHEMWQQRRAEREERRRKREERREWRREKRALKRGADPRKRKGDFVPLIPQSAPDASEGELRMPYLAKRAIMMGEIAEPTTSSSATPAFRGRQRSRSAEGRREGLEGRQDGQGAEAPFRAAARVSSSSRSRSRNPPPLGRIGPGGRLTSASGHSRPNSSSGLRFTTDGAGAVSPAFPMNALDAASSSPLVSESGLEFSRRAVPRSRSPSSAFPPPGTLLIKSRTNSSSAGESDPSGAVPRPFTAASTFHRRAPSSSSGAGGFARSATGSLSRDELGQRQVSPSMAASPSVQRFQVGMSGDHGQAVTEEAGATSHGSVTSRGRPREASGSGIKVIQDNAQAGGSGVAGHTSSPRPLDRRVSRSPSMARMRVRGFGDREEVWIDGEEISAGEAARTQQQQKVTSEAKDDQQGGQEDADAVHEASQVATVDETTDQGMTTAPHETRRLSLVGEESGSDSRDEAVERRGETTASEDPTATETAIKTASERASGLATSPELSDGDKAEHSSSESEDGSGSEDGEDIADEDLDEDEAEPLCDGVSSLISEPSRASPEENAWIAAMVAQKDDTVAQGFFQLLPYLNGRHTIDEVICREEMRRRELRNLLGYFKEEILTFVHP